MLSFLRRLGPRHARRLGRTLVRIQQARFVVAGLPGSEGSGRGGRGRASRVPSIRPSFDGATRRRPERDQTRWRNFPSLLPVFFRGSFREELSLLSVELSSFWRTASPPARLASPTPAETNHNPISESYKHRSTSTTRPRLSGHACGGAVVKAAVGLLPMAADTKRRGFWHCPPPSGAAVTDSAMLLFRGPPAAAAL